MYRSVSASNTSSWDLGSKMNEENDDWRVGQFWSNQEETFPNYSSGWINSTFNGSNELELPIDMQFNAGHLLSIVVYSVLFVFSASGNVTVLIVLLRRRKARLVFPPMDFMLLNLAIADLMVTFLMMPLEVAWSWTVQWHGGDLLCRVMAFFRMFGLYLSSFVLVCLAVDRYMAVKFPMHALSSGVRRSRRMIAVSWILSIFFSSPQSMFFQVQHHPVFTWYKQCVVYSSLPTKNHVFAYFLFGMFFTYLVPFIIILTLYCGIVIELIKIHRESKTQLNNGRNEGGGLRRSGIGNIGKAKDKALKMTLIIAVIFFICWTPYYIISLWYFIDESSFQQYPRLNKALFFFACTNSTANPIVYGILHLKSNANTLRRNNCGTLQEGISRDFCSRRQIVAANNTFQLEETETQNVTVYGNRISILKRSDLLARTNSSRNSNAMITPCSRNNEVEYRNGSL